MTPVALLAEGVGRNPLTMDISAVEQWVALLAEGVGRNRPKQTLDLGVDGRPPRGGRG